MLPKQISFIVLLLFAIGLTGALAQQSINASGGNATGSGGSVSYSVGQVVYRNHTGPNGSIVEGMQLPYEISVVTGIEAANGINLYVSVYPNPTADYLTLEVINFELNNLHYLLYNIQGKLLQTARITDTQTSISFSNLVTGTYFLKVMGNINDVITFKILKK